MIINWINDLYHTILQSGTNVFIANNTFYALEISIGNRQMQRVFWNVFCNR